MNPKFVYSKPNQLRWYHWTLIAVQSVGVLFGIMSLGYSLTTGSRRSTGNSVSVLGMTITIWTWSALGMLRKKSVMVYDDSKIIRGENMRIRVNNVLFSQISNILKRSDNCIEIQFKERVQVGNLTSDKLQISGNEDDLMEFCKTISNAGIAMTDDPIPDDDPTKEAGVLVASVVLIIFMMFGAVWIASRAAKI